jgi:nucleoid-associated protein YgaU
MRKDAKIGFAIGGVLLAVLTVYVLVVPSHKRARTINGVTLEVPPGTAGGTSDTPAPAAPTATADAKSDQPAADAKPAVARNDGVNWEKILGGTGDAPTLKTATPASTDAPVTPEPAIASNTTPASADMPLAAVTPMAPTPMVAMAPSTQPAGSRTYTIKPGQTLSLIAAEIYGNSRFYVAIKRANPNIDANHLKPGMRITLPDISDVKPEGSHEGLVKLVGENGAAVSTGKTYKVQSGDTLYRISKSLYGSGKQAEALYELNRDLIGPDKGRLKLGMVLRLPVSPVAGATASSR